MKPLTGRTAFVTGATGYLGRSMCYALAEAGAHVIVNARRSIPCHALVEELTALNMSAEPAIFDISDTEAVNTYIRQRGQKTPLHILINNVGHARGGTLDTSTDEDFSEAYDICVMATQRLIRLFLPALRAARRTSNDSAIVNVASMYGLVSPDLRTYSSAELSNPPSYGVAKAGLIQLTRYTACQLALEGIRCNAIAPGPFPNPNVQSDMPEMVKQLTDRIPMGRIGQACEIGGPVVFLASPAASYITGAILPIDGGWTAW